MVKKISIIALVIVVLASGYLSLRKLNYWERSIMIFKYDSSQQSFGGRGGRGFGEFEGRMQGRRDRSFSGTRNRPDSLTASPLVREQNFSTRGDFGGIVRGHGGNEGRGDRRGNAVNLNMVGYYLAVFALFTLLVVYLEKGYRLIFKQKKLSKENSDLII